MNPNRTRPEWMILKCLVVPPFTVRPNGIHDLSPRLEQIVKCNNMLRKCIGEGRDFLVKQLSKLLQLHVARYLDIEQVNRANLSEFQKMPSGNPLWEAEVAQTGEGLRVSALPLAERLRGRKGRIRANITGKEVNFCARTVISPDPNIGIDEAGLPLSIAMRVTFTEIVTSFNLAW